MKHLKIQQEILKALLANPETVKYYTTDNGDTFVTVNLKTGYLIPRGVLRLDLTGAQNTFDPDLASVVRPVNLLQGSDDYRLKGTARRYERLPGSVSAHDTYIYTELLKHFDNPILYQGPSPLGLIVVTEDPLDDGREQIVGIVMPCKVQDDDVED